MKEEKNPKGVRITKHGLAPMLLLEWMADNRGIEVRLYNDAKNEEFILFVFGGNEYVLQKEIECLMYIKDNL